ncbi:MAG: response regulator [Gammaproteobacteria bacterium]|nr:MAG: response regulator [Gammaproteobacteria bacterium]
MTTLSILLLVYIISLVINLAFAIQFWLAYRTTTYKKLVILWLLTTLNFILQGIVADSVLGSLLTFPTYIVVAYYACSLLAETSSMPFKFKPFGIIYLTGIVASLTIYATSNNFTYIAIPVALGVAAPQIFFALNKLIKYRHTGTQFGNSFAILLLLNGIHFLDYPFLRPDPQFAIFGFGLVLIYSVGFAALLPSILSKYHTDRSDHLLNEIKKREKVEKDLAAALEKAEHLTKVKSIFLANVSHEIRTPLTGIIGLNDLLLKTNLNSEQKEYCHDIADSSQKLRRIINNVLNLSKLESGTVIVEQEDFTLQSVVTEINSHYRRHNKSDIQIICSSESDMPPMVVGDKGKIQQIIFNLIDNAIKYSKGDCIKFKLTYDYPSNSIDICVSDNGIGIPSNIIDQLFLRFEQKHTQNEGVGLGLAIVEQLVTLMQGNISVISELSNGATFTCKIPAAVTNESNFSVNTPTQLSTNRISEERKFNLLVIDDHELNLKTVSTLLTQAGYNCVLAENGNVAKKSYDENNIDLILTDMQLPDVNGFDLIKYFRQKSNNIPIVVYSAFAFDEDVAAAMAVGATDYLRKPAMFTEIENKLNLYLV